MAGGIDVTTTAAILGHSTPTVTLSIYSHVVDGNERAAMDVLGDRPEQIRNRVVDAPPRTADRAFKITPGVSRQACAV